MWILIDNYDSFTHILHHYLLQLHADVLVFRNDEITLPGLAALQPQKIIISPGGKTPKEAGITNEAIACFHQQIPILGICLGHQALAQFYGAELTKASRPMHGMTSKIYHSDEGFFQHIPSGFTAMRYHSLLIRNFEKIDIDPLAFTENHELMAFRHKIYPSSGIQFHPESILTEYGMQLLVNWNNMYP